MSSSSNWGWGLTSNFFLVKQLGWHHSNLAFGTAWSCWGAVRSYGCIRISLFQGLRSYRVSRHVIVHHSFALDLSNTRNTKQMFIQAPPKLVTDEQGMTGITRSVKRCKSSAESESPLGIFITPKGGSAEVSPLKQPSVGANPPWTRTHPNMPCLSWSDYQRI